MRFPVLILVLGMSTPGTTQAMRPPVLVWSERAHAYQPASPATVQAVRQVLSSRSREFSESDLMQGSGSAVRDYNLEIDSWVGYTGGSRRIIPGPSLMLHRFNERWKANLDAGSDFLGLSISREFSEILRPALGLGIGRDFDSNSYVFFGKASFRSW